ncbi:ribonuclease H-like domain-containing protein [Tanacetum coccineum]
MTVTPTQHIILLSDKLQTQMLALIQTYEQLLDHYGYNGTANVGQSLGNSSVGNSSQNNIPVALLTNLNAPAQPFAMHHSPPDFGLSQQGYYKPAQPAHVVKVGQQVSVGQLGQPSGHDTILPNAFNAMTLQDPATGNWNMDTGASSHLNDSVTTLSDVLNMCIYPYVLIGDSIPITNMGHSILPTPHCPLHLNNVLITPNIVKNLIYVRQFVRDNNCTVDFDAFGFSIKDFMTRRVLLRCDSIGDLYPVTKPSTIPHAFLTNGTLSRYKALLVANGSTHLEGIDVDETFSPVVKPSTIQTILSLPTSRHWLVHQLDVKNAFLHEVSLWAEAGPSGQRTNTTYLLLYVGDIVLTASFETFLQQIIASLHQEFSMTDPGSLNYFLDISVTRDSSGMFLSQRKYVVEILERCFTSINAIV